MHIIFEQDTGKILNLTFLSKNKPYVLGASEVGANLYCNSGLATTSPTTTRGGSSTCPTTPISGFLITLGKPQKKVFF